MRYLLIAFVVLLCSLIATAENYLLNGGQQSVIRYKMVQQIEPSSETVTVDLTFVVPMDFRSETYSQSIRNLTFDFSIAPQKKSEFRDDNGNLVRKFSWVRPGKAFKASVSFEATNSVQLKEINTVSPFPPTGLDPAVNKYLQSTEQVPADNPQIRRKSKELLKDVKTQFEAVQRILSWIIDHMQYVLTPEKYDALYSLGTGKGNCQNYSHLAAALMRAAGIPVRIVNGVTLKRPFDVRVGSNVLTLNMAQGRHSWIEVYFPDLGWMPFDPQQSELFVSNRFIRVEVGRDNNETVNDGLIRWTRKRGSKSKLSFTETIEADFVQDEISLTGNRMQYGPRKLLLFPGISSKFVAAKTPQEKPPVKPEADIIRRFKYEKPFIYGNLEFPEGVNFAFPREVQQTDHGKVQEMKRSFLVETAEYVTSNREYAQTFLLNETVLLQKIGLALHNFGGSGKVWVQLHEDQNGKPGPVAAKSKTINLQYLKTVAGYYWIDFDFVDQKLILTPDRYWMTLGFSGAPIINWFYSYGKPVGPIDGTRYRPLNSGDWNRSLSYEFNYRITGLKGTL